MAMRSHNSRRRVGLAATVLVIGVVAAIIVWTSDPICVGENSGTLTEQKLESGDLTLVYRELVWSSPYVSPVYVFNAKAHVLSRVSLEAERRDESVFDFVLEQRRLEPAETRGLREILIAEGLDKWPEHINPKGFIDGVQWYFETWEGERLVQSTVFDNVEPRCARNVLRAMSDLLEMQGNELRFRTGDVFLLSQAQSIEQLLRSADSLLEFGASPLGSGTLRVRNGSECAVVLRGVVSQEGVRVGALLAIDEPLAVKTEGRERPLPHGDLFGVPIADADGPLLHFVIDGTIDSGIDLLVRETADGWSGELRYLSDAGITVIGELELQPFE